MRYGVVILPERHWALARTVWRRAEELGFDHAWTFDHLAWRWLRDDAWFGAVPTLTAAATVTTRIRLGPLVASPRLRSPLVLAKELMTIDDISGGRVVCGVGAGSHDPEVIAGGELPRSAQAARFSEFVEVLDGALRRRPGPDAGRWYRSHDLVLTPGCVQSPRLPLAVAAGGPRGMRLAARRADTWVTSGVPVSFELQPYADVAREVRGQVEALERACDEVGRDPATIDRMLLSGASVGGVLDSVASFQDATATFADLGITDLVVNWPRPAFPFAARMDVLEEIAAEVLTRPERTGASEVRA
jgi:alkanesulfonate monooxygenase SsuD/methylene tetrahydromethanopterin reductase-like flavin-dependent oxidoreductase (luciferase family)